MRPQKSTESALWIPGFCLWFLTLAVVVVILILVAIRFNQKPTCKLPPAAQVVATAKLSSISASGCVPVWQVDVPKTILSGGKYCAQEPLTLTSPYDVMFSVFTTEAVTINFGGNPVYTNGTQRVVFGSVPGGIVDITVLNTVATSFTRTTSYSGGFVQVANGTVTLRNIKVNQFAGVAGIFGGSIDAANVEYRSFGPLVPTDDDSQANTAYVLFGDSKLRNVDVAIQGDNPLTFGAQGIYTSSNYWNRFATYGFNHQWTNLNIEAQSGAWVLAARQLDLTNYDVNMNSDGGIGLLFGFSPRVTFASNGTITRFNITMPSGAHGNEGILVFAANTLRLVNGQISGDASPACHPPICPLLPAPVATGLLHIVPGRPAAGPPQSERQLVELTNVKLLTNAGGAAALIHEPAALLTGAPVNSMFDYRSGQIVSDGYGAYFESDTHDINIDADFSGGYYGIYAKNSVSDYEIQHCSFADECVGFHVGTGPLNVDFSFNRGRNVSIPTQYVGGPSGITENDNRFIETGGPCGTPPPPLLTYYNLIGGGSRRSDDVWANNKVEAYQPQMGKH